MHLVRDIFQCKPGKAGELAANSRRPSRRWRRRTASATAVCMVDAVASYWTVVLGMRVRSRWTTSSTTWPSTRRRDDVREAMAGIHGPRRRRTKRDLPDRLKWLFTTRPDHQRGFSALVSLGRLHLCESRSSARAESAATSAGSSRNGGADVTFIVRGATLDAHADEGTARRQHQGRLRHRASQRHRRPDRGRQRRRDLPHRQDVADSPKPRNRSSRCSRDDTMVIPLENGIDAPDQLAAILGRAARPRRLVRHRQLHRRAGTHPPHRRRSVRHVR